MFFVYISIQISLNNILFLLNINYQCRTKRVAESRFFIVLSARVVWLDFA
nr:MAG TPA: hypothetical protein [Caudoviricetes sp.]